MLGSDFTHEHIKNYLKLYGAVVVIMILFFIAAKLYYKPQEVIEKKEFATGVVKKHTEVKKVQKPQEQNKSGLKLLEKAY